MDFLELAQKRGVRNIEMESLAFGAFTSTIKVKAACVAVTLLNRFEGDSVKSSPETLLEYESRITKLILEFVRKDFEVRLGWDKTLSAYEIVKDLYILNLAKKNHLKGNVDSSDSDDLSDDLSGIQA